jgi:hypothetical protein
MPRNPPKQRTLSVTEGCEPSDFAAWKKATRLSDVVTERLAKMPRDEQHEAEAEFGEPGRYDRWRRRKVEELLKAELIQGRHAIYAAYPGEPPHEINEIAPELIVGLTLDSATNSSKGRRRELINIRVGLEAGDGRDDKSTRANLARELPNSLAAREDCRPKQSLAGLSRKEVRELAIKACATPRPIEWWQQSKADRRRGYLDWLRKQHQFEAAKLYGYGSDSWEASENKFKRDHGLLKSKSPNR